MGERSQSDESSWEGFGELERRVADMEQRTPQEVGDCAENHGDGNCSWIFLRACSMTAQHIRPHAPASQKILCFPVSFLFHHLEAETGSPGGLTLGSSFHLSETETRSPQPASGESHRTPLLGSTPPRPSVRLVHRERSAAAGAAGARRIRDPRQTRAGVMTESVWVPYPGSACDTRSAAHYRRPR